MTCLHLLLAIATALGASPVMAQEPAGAESFAPLIKVTTNLLQVSVVVRDSKGRPVSNLSRNDFTLYDEGRRQKIVDCTKETNEVWPDQAAGSVEGLVSNRFATFVVNGETRARPLPNSVTAILLDGLNTRFSDQARVKESLIQLLKQLHSGDSVAIYALTDRLHVVHDFTSDVPALLAALDRLRPQESRTAASSVYEDSNTGIDYLDGMINRANAKLAGFSHDDRAGATAIALQAIANHLAGIKGRKNLIWVSSNFPLPMTATEQQTTWRGFNDAGIAIYPVDARGLIGMTEWMPSLGASSTAKIVTGKNPEDRRAQRQIEESHTVADVLAERTGGRACRNNDVSGCIRRALDDSEVTYVLSFTPSHNQWDGRFREIKVKLNRAGLEARYRKGYYALPDLPSDQTTRQSLLQSAAMSPLVSTGLTIVAKLLEKPTDLSRQAALSIVLDWHEVAFESKAEGTREATLDVRAVVFGAEMAALKTTGQTAHLELKPSQYDRFLKEGELLTIKVEVPAGSERVRVVVRDAASGRLGAVDVPIR
ncbi:MAG TPA: VWA domain-containing protein [Bryobacteraceae bacterium]|nr:VWA domain-containing protein [Bryobacteraceae bacterium]